MTDQNNSAHVAGQILTYLGYAQAVSMEPGADSRRDHIQSLINSLLAKLRAPVADEQDRNATISKVVGLCNRIPGATTWNAAEFMYDEMHRRAALAVADERAAVAYLDLGAGGYMDVGTDLTDEQLAALPKGRHMLAIIGTHGVDGYTPASAPVAGEAQQPSDKDILARYAAPQASEAVRDALIPFAAMDETDLIGTAYEGKGDDAEILHFHRTGKSVTLGDFRRARAALSAQPAQKEQNDE
ncbi:hypothetical protein [Achromobacter denitrificans]|uniref:hypothetical protein n=1 Tax=Achromobacter denitrificans TaxID=32002 RepID=UPI000F68F1FE|nr:hypothetical protein [Achromobacter denitrificans]RSE85537.1 hypothetical protein EGU64_12605 [Achromobacter denitrificans]